MSRVSMIKVHPKRAAIEAALAAKVPLTEIAERFGVSIWSASRHRTFLKKKRHTYFYALRRATSIAAQGDSL